ncbi:MAG: transposase [Chthoniobacteraceae bacterium]
MQRKYKDKPPRLDVIFQRFDLPVYFVTFNTNGRNPILASDGIHRAFQTYCHRALDFEISVGRYVIMPDHIHLFIGIGNRSKVSLSRWVQGLKRHLHLALLELGHEPIMRANQKLKSFWQPGFHDHLLRNDESYASKWEYVRQNPIRAGFVANPEGWPFQGEVTLIDRI